ncbi:hypothetical protein ACSBR2_023140 [Camellia fascicularis]
MENKLADLQSVVNFMIQNNVMQPPFPLQDTSTPAAKTDAQKGRQKAVPIVPQHGKGQGNSHWPSKDIGRTKSV